MNNTGPIDIKLDYYFPWTFRIPAIVGFGLSALFVLENIYASLAGITICILILTSRYGFVIDPQKKEYKDYLWLLGYKKGRMERYDSVDHLGIKEKKVNRTYNSRTSSSTFTYTEFEGFILFSGNNKIELLSSQKEKKVRSKVMKLSKALEAPFLEKTESTN